MWITRQFLKIASISARSGLTDGRFIGFHLHIENVNVKVTPQGRMLASRFEYVSILEL